MYHFYFHLPKNDLNGGCVYMPHRNSTNLPMMIYCQGFGSSIQPRRVQEKLRDTAVNKYGMGFVYMDLFGCTSKNPRGWEHPPTGETKDMTYARWKENLADMLQWVRAKKFTDKNKIGVYAYSSATTAALRLAAENDPAFVISTSTCATDHIGMGNGGPAKILADNMVKLQAGETVEFMGIEYGINFFTDAVSNAPVHNLAEIECPVLFLQGTSDNPYRRADAFTAYELLKLFEPETKSKHIEFEGGDHCLYNIEEQAMSEIFNWLKEINII